MLAQLKSWVADRLAPDQGQARGRAVRRPRGGRDLRRAGAEPDPRASTTRSSPTAASGQSCSTGGATLPGYAKCCRCSGSTPRTRGGAHLGSAYDGGFEGYLMSTFQQLLGQKPADGFGPRADQPRVRRRPGHLPRARSTRRLQTTYDALVKANGSTDVASWTDSTESQAAGADHAASTTRSSFARWESSASRTSTGRTGRPSSRSSSSRGTEPAEVEWTSQLSFMLTR